MRPKFNTVSSQLDLSWRCVPKFYTVLSVGPFLCNARLKMRPKFLYCVFSVGPFLYNAGLKMRPKVLYCVSSVGPFLCNAGLKMRPKFNTVSSQLDLSCTILDWRCVPKFYTVLSVGLFLCNARLEMRPKFLYWFFSVFLRLNLSRQCLVGDASKV